MIIAELVVPQMFTAYAEEISYLNNGLHHYQYFCENCDQAFCSAWGRIPGSLSYYERGSYFTCPYCGHRHHKHVVYIKRNEAAPNKIRLAVKEYKDLVTLEVTSKVVVFTDYLHLIERDYKEVFRFDIAKQSATFLANYRRPNSTLDAVNPLGLDESIEIGNPFVLEITRSILRFFQPFSLASTEQRSKLNSIIKILRTTIQRKLEKHLKHKISSMYVSHGPYYGNFILPIFNIAYRLSCPDAPNLPTEYRDDHEAINYFWKSKFLNSDAFNKDLMDYVITMTRKKHNFVAAIIKTKGLPDKTFVRRTLSTDPFSVGLLAKAFSLCKNYDCSIRMYEALKSLGEDGRLRWMVNDELSAFLCEMKLTYGEIGIVRLVEEAEKFELHDCVRLYQQLTSENKAAIQTESVRLRDLHDWMSLRHKKQTHKNLKFEVPEHIIKRLSMQTDRLKFFMPKESMELIEAGHTLHNCVASYGSSMKSNQNWIVLVADDKGKLAACLEVRGKELKQAKINKNAPVSSDKTVNSAVIAWAKEANIEIKTSDVNLPNEKSFEKIG